MVTKKKNKKFNRKPPFYWSLIIFVVIILETAVLVKERAWSQKYVVSISNIRDQVEKIDSENKLIASTIYKLYSLVLENLENNSSSLLAIPKREIIFKNKKSAILGVINEKSPRY